MKKLSILLAALLITVGAFAQTEQGKMRVGGTTNLSFSNVKYDGADVSWNTFSVGAGAGYFLINDLSLDLDLGFLYQKVGDNSGSQLGATLGLRYYLPMKIFFGAGFNLAYESDGDDSATGMGVQFGAGYAAFLTDSIALEPMVGYRLGLSDKDKGTKFNGLYIGVGFSFYF